MEDILPRFRGTRGHSATSIRQGYSGTGPGKTYGKNAGLQLARTAGYRNFVTSSGRDIPPGTPAENIDVFFETVDFLMKIEGKLLKNSGSFMIRKKSVRPHGQMARAPRKRSLSLRMSFSYLQSGCGRNDTGRMVEREQQVILLFDRHPVWHAMAFPMFSRRSPVTALSGTFPRVTMQQGLMILDLLQQATGLLDMISSLAAGLFDSLPVFGFSLKACILWHSLCI